MAKRGQSAAYLKRLRKKYRLGEYQKRGRRRRRKSRKKLTHFKML